MVQVQMLKELHEMLKILLKHYKNDFCLYKGNPNTFLGHIGTNSV